MSSNQNKIRVLHIGLCSHLGGIETYLRKITSHVNKDNYQFDFLVEKGSNPCFYDELLNMGCNFYRYTPRRVNYKKSIQDLNLLFKQENFDIVHCHLNSLSCITHILIALKHNCKVIVHSRNAGCLKSLKSRLLHKINYYRLPQEKITCVAVSDLAGEWMFGEKSEVMVLNNGLETNDYCFSEDLRNKIRKELNINDECVIVHTGAFRTQKNHTKIINIFNEYQKINPKSILLLIGEGELKSYIESKVKILGLDDKVLFLGKRNDVRAILSAGDYFLFPSFYEGFPNAVLEAEASGLYCFISDTITKEVCIEGMSDMLSINQSDKEWANKINECHVNITRTDCGNLIKSKGLGIEQEIKKLSHLYKSLI